MTNLSAVATLAFTFVGACLLISGCDAPTSAEREVDVADINYLNDSAIDNAIIAQHTLYPYHFTPDAPSTNELGDHDLNVLIEHFKMHPGTLNVRRGDASAELYEARVDFVVERLKQAQVTLGPIEDGPPGGSGAPSDRVLFLLKRCNQKPERPSPEGEVLSTGTPAAP
jgi:hypothetical protein